MTDPVNTDALRAIAEGFEAKGWVNNAQHCRAAADEVYRLRAVIENAPHDPFCKSRSYVDGNEWIERGSLPCTCWKADAL